VTTTADHIPNQGPIYSQFGGDSELRELVELFVQEMPDRIATLRRAHHGGDRDTLIQVAHQLKGAAGSYGFDTLTAPAKTLETAVRDGQAKDQVESALETLLQLCERVTAGEAS